MAETRKLAAILAADVAGYSKLAGADEERTLATLRALRSDLFDPTIALHHGRVVKRTGDGVLIEFRSGFVVLGITLGRTKTRRYARPFIARLTRGHANGPRRACDAPAGVSSITKKTTTWGVARAPRQFSSSCGAAVGSHPAALHSPAETSV
jgi:hypothetical protein